MRLCYICGFRITFFRLLGFGIKNLGTNTGLVMGNNNVMASLVTNHGNKIITLILYTMYIEWEEIKLCLLFIKL